MLGAVMLLAACHGSAAGPSQDNCREWAGSDSGKLNAKAGRPGAPGPAAEVMVDSDAGLGLRYILPRAYRRANIRLPVQGRIRLSDRERQWHSMVHRDPD
jgi:hypothetical protein